jgi:hypothetical protein
MRQILLICCIGLFMMTANSCKRNELGPVDNDGVAPGPVSNLSVLNLNGAATVTFTSPTDPDLAYVKAKYTTKDGIVRETKVSRYNNKITLEGFADTDTYTVTLTAVDKGENASPSVNITVNPLKPIYKIAFETIKTARDFGGINIKVDNPNGASLAVIVLTDDSLKNFVPAQTFYTDVKDVNFSVRGFKAIDRKFGIVVRDRWGNRSDTLDVNLTPLFEERLSRTAMSGFTLPTDATLGHSGTYAGLFDDNLTGGWYHSADGNVMPQWFTYNMGVTAKLSRLVYFMKPNKYFDEHNPRIVEIYGSNAPNPDGSFDSSWTLLTTYTMVKPSGTPAPQLTQADITAAQEGATITFPLDAPRVRYIRFKTLKNWGNTPYVSVYEIRMFGDSH